MYPLRGWLGVKVQRQCSEVWYHNIGTCREGGSDELLDASRLERTGEREEKVQDDRVVCPRKRRTTLSSPKDNVPTTLMTKTTLRTTPSVSLTQTTINGS